MHLAEEAGYSVVQRGQNDRVWAKVTAKQDSNGATTLITNTFLTRRHAYMRGHGAGDPGLHPEWNTRKVWFCTQNNEVVEARIKEGYVHAYLGDGLDYSVVIFQNDVTNTITPMAVMVAPANYGVPYHVHYKHTINNVVSTFTTGDSQTWWFGGNSGSPFMIARTDGALVFFGGATTSSPSVPPPGTDPIQADMDFLSIDAGLNPSNYQMTWYTP